MDGLNENVNAGQKDAITTAVVPPVKLAVCFDGQNKESSGLAAQLIGALEQGGATVMRPQPAPLTVWGMTGIIPTFGILSAGVPAAVLRFFGKGRVGRVTRQCDLFLAPGL